VSNRGGYDYQQHCEVDSSNSKFVTDDIVDRFCVVGPAEAHRNKLRKLAELGVTQFNVYLMCGEEEATLEEYKKEILPAFQRSAV
jgi:alkanesulfonate monooxygenase SsuD/methylene tetrahydromethanopterin reductase-like flavin-dependent oxidoreductase (luciferase family)